MVDPFDSVERVVWRAEKKDPTPDTGTKIRISKEEDRLTAAAILIKNGYTVCIKKEKRVTGKNYDYYLYYSL